MATHGGNQGTARANGPGRIALRSLSAAVVVGFSVFAFGFQSPVSHIQTPAGALDEAAVRVVPPSGVVGPALLDPGSTSEGRTVAGPAAALVAKVPFGRTIVETSSKGAISTGTVKPQSPGVASTA